MAAGNQLDLHALTELVHRVRPEHERRAPVVPSVAADVLVGVGPQQVHEQRPVLRHHRPLDGAQLVERAEVLREAAVHAQDLVRDPRAEGQAVEHVLKNAHCLLAGNQFKHRKREVADLEGEVEAVAVVSAALVEEAIDALDAGALVVAAQEVQVVRVLDLVGQQQTDRLQSLAAAIDVVSQEHVVAG